MKGYLLNFYKFSPTNFGNKHNTSPEFVRSIVWSSFDRLEVREIFNFQEYRLSKFSEKNWLGERQFAMIYELDDTYNSLVYKHDQVDECEFIFDSFTNEEQIKMRFFGITLIDFTPEIHRYFYDNKDKTLRPGECIHKLLRNAINSVIDKNNIPIEGISYEVYGVLGGQDVVVIWLANQFEDIAKVIEGVRKSKTKDNYNVVANIYTVIGLKDVNNKNITYCDVRGELHIKLTKKDSFDLNVFENDLEQIFGKENEDNRKRVYYSIFGEHDLILSISGRDLVSTLYERDGIFNSKSSNFVQNFMQSKTEITVENQYDKIIGYTFPINTPHSKLYVLTDKKINEYVEKIDQVATSDCFIKASYLQETLWLLYEDFLKNIMSSFSYPWTSDLDYQFENCLDYLLALVNSNIDNDRKYKNIHHLIGSMRQMMLHVAQANRIFFEIPNTQLKHTGAYSKILHTYYGVVKQYLNLVYSIPKFDSQSPIVPFISFDVTPITKSRFCDDIDSYKNKIIRIRLPYEALINISKYIKLLAHEIYHYIAPADRVRRNILIGTISFSIIMGQMSKLFFRDYVALLLPEISFESIKKDKEKQALWEYQLNKISKIIQINVLNFSDLAEKFKIWIDNYTENAEWETYFNKFSSSLISKLKIPSSLTNTLFELIQNINEVNGMDELTRKFIVKAKECDINKFNNWIIQENPINKVNSEDSDLRYSLREAMADHFMIQSTNMSIKEYINYVYEYKELVSKKPEHIRQSFRVALIVDHYLSNDIKSKINFKEKPVNDIFREVFIWFSNTYEFDDNICEWIGKSYTEFVLGFEIYGELFKQYFDLLNFSTYNQKQYYPEFSNCLTELRNSLNTKFENEFDNNINYIEAFQNQEELRSLANKMRYELPTNRPKFYPNFESRIGIYTREDKSDFVAICSVTNLIELINAIKNAVGDIKEERENVPIWFRGQASSNYLLIPSLYRMKDKQKLFYNSSMRLTLQSLVELFKSKAYNAPELIGDGCSVITNCLISMQHYSVPTNILDWTTSAFVAIYFALEKEFNCEEKKVQDDAVIYLLNPIRLNIARERLLLIYGEQSEKEELKFPITALTGHDEKFSDYIPNYENREHKEYPIAVYAPFVNHRIKSQLGTFTMFGLDNKAKNVVQDNEIVAKDYSMYSLLDVQKQYKEMCESLKDKIIYRHFLTEVRISANCKQEIADNLRTLGIGKVNVYPELENIAEGLTKEVKMYFDMKN